MANEHDSASISNIKELNFFRRGVEVNPDEIFNETYAPLDELVEYNRRMYLGSFRTMSMGNSHPGEDKVLEELAVKANSEIEEIRAVGGIAAVAEFESGKKENYIVSPRTNYHKTLLKRPNIVHLLNSKGAPGIILREARSYDPETRKAVTKSARSLVKTHLVGDLTTRMKDQMEFIPGKPTDVHLIPEPHLVLALEQANLERTAPRLTPEIKVVGVNSNSLWYVRDFLPAVRDASMNPMQVSNYFGRLHALGLMDNLDMQLVHYCLSGDNVVNIDPDFVLHTQSDLLVEHQAWGALKRDPEWKDSAIVSEDYFSSPKGKENYRAAFREAREKINPISFIGYIPKQLQSAPILKSIYIGSPDNTR